MAQVLSSRSARTCAPRGRRQGGPARPRRSAARATGNRRFRVALCVTSAFGWLGATPHHPNASPPT
jgi:hypothetical protein